MKNTTPLPTHYHDATHCTNLRPAPGADGHHHLTPVPAPTPIDTIAWRTIGLYTTTPGSNSDSGSGIPGTITEIFTAGTMLAVANYPIGTTTPPQPRIIASDIIGTLTTTHRSDDGYIALGTHSRYHITYDTDGHTPLCRQLPEPADYPTVTTLITSENTIDIPVGGFNLTGTYTTLTPTPVTLTPADAARAATAMTDAYCQASYTAATTSAFISPVFTRYRLYDTNGNILFTSLPKLHVPTTRHDTSLTTTLTLSGNHVNTGHLAVPRYELSATVATDVNTPAARHVARLDIQLTPQLHTIDASLWPLHRLDIPASTLHITAPGCDDPTLMHRHILDILPDIDSLFYTATTITHPFDTLTSADTTLRIHPRRNSVAADRAALSRHTAPAGPGWLSHCLQPHAIYATTAHRDGDITFLANIHAKPFPGHPLEYYTNSATTPADATLSAVTVTLADGTRLTTPAVTTRWWRDTPLSPLIIYPDPTAVTVTLQQRDSSGTNHTLTLPLTPCGHYAVHLAGDLRPHTLDPTTAPFDAPPTTATARHLPGTLIAIDHTGNITGTRITDGTIHAITPTPTPSTSHWEKSRSRLYIFSTDGIFSLATSGLQLATPIQLDTRPVYSPYAVAQIKNPTPAVAAIAARDLVTVTGNRVTTLATDIDASMLAWCNRHSELLAITRSATASIPSHALIYHTTTGGWSHRQYPPISSTYTHPVASRLTSSILATSFDLTHDLPDPVDCSYTYPLIRDNNLNPASLPYIAEVIAPLTATTITGTITITAHNGLPPAATLTRYDLKGTLERPLYLHTIIPRRSHIDINITATMSLDTHLAPPCIHLTTRPLGHPDRATDSH